MFVRLSFNATAPLHRSAFEVLWYILNNPSITSVADMTSRGDWTNSTFSFGSNVVTNFNAANSLIVRTVEPTNVQAHRFVDSTGATNTITFRFQSYDEPTQKYYFQCTGSSSAIFNLRSGTAVSPSFDTAPTVSASGSRMTLSNQNDMINLNSSYGYRDAWFYITNNIILFYGTTASASSGFGNINTVDGPYILAQYSRFDSFNTASVGMIPVVVSPAYSAASPYYGLHAGYFTSIKNPLAATTETALKAMTVYNVAPTTTSAVPTIAYNQNVHVGIGTRSTENGLLTTATTSTTSGAAVNGQSISTTSGHLIRNSTNTGNGFSLLPLFWSFGHYNLSGGNITDKTGIYIANGDFSAGDDFSLDGKTYIVWPLNEATITSRIGLAVPRE